MIVLDFIIFHLICPRSSKLVRLDLFGRLFQDIPTASVKNFFIKVTTIGRHLKYTQIQKTNTNYLYCFSTFIFTIFYLLQYPRKIHFSFMFWKILKITIFTRVKILFNFLIVVYAIFFSSFKQFYHPIYANDWKLLTCLINLDLKQFR